MRDFNKDRYFQDWLRKQEEEKKLKEERRRKRIIQENRERRKRHQMMMQEQLMAQTAAFNDAVINASVDSGGDSGGGDTDVSAFLTATGISDSTIETALTTFVTTLKTESLWDKMVAIYPFVTDKTDSVDIQGQFKYNLKDPQDTNAAYRLTTIGSVTYSTLGVTNFNTGNWLKNWIVSDNSTDFPTGPNWIAMGWYLQTNTDTDYGVIGSNDAGTIQDPYYIRPADLGAGYRYYFMYGGTGNTSQPATGANSLGTHIFSRISNTQIRIINPLQDILKSYTLSFTSASETIGIGYRGSQTDNILSGYFFSDSLDLAEMTTMQTAFNQLQTDLGRAVH